VWSGGFDERLRPLGLSETDKADLVALLRALTGDNLNLFEADAEAAPWACRHESDHETDDYQWRCEGEEGDE